MKLHLGSVHKNKVVFILMKIVHLHPENLMKYVRLLSYYQTWELNTTSLAVWFIVNFTDGDARA